MRALKALNSAHKPSLLHLSEIKLSSLARFSHIAKLLGFSHFEFVPATDSAGGIALLWKDTLDVRILVSNSNLINALVFSDPVDTPWQITWVYGPPIPSQRNSYGELWMI